MYPCKGQLGGDIRYRHTFFASPRLFLLKNFSPSSFTVALCSLYALFAFTKPNLVLICQFQFQIFLFLLHQRQLTFTSFLAQYINLHYSYHLRFAKRLCQYSHFLCTNLGNLHKEKQTFDFCDICDLRIQPRPISDTVLYLPHSKSRSYAPSEQKSFSDDERRKT